MMDGGDGSSDARSPSPVMSARMLSATTWACRLAMPAILWSAAATSPTAKTRSCPATCKYGVTSTKPSVPAGRGEVAGEVVADRA